MSDRAQIKYQILWLNEEGQEIGRRKIAVEQDDLAAVSYIVGIKAEELFRDALFQDGLWDKYRATRGRKNFWTQE